ncbi:MAG: adenylate/guanylate cyclase domain-containing protein [Proteobacteria bacterium]|nr:adenylate/guanylate cyclase domain-containing protein [Pseudomonadota bacterium]MBU1709438.1 adenylate/guanylate cyclase domain-containing protein [Pseudomonadota bacterium]
MKKTWKINFITLAGLAITALFFLLNISSPRIVNETIEAMFLDYRFQLRNIISPPPPPENILIIAVDEKSLDIFGRWPWARDLQSELIDTIITGDPRILVVDIFYPEPENPQRDAALGSVFEKYYGRIALAAGFDPNAPPNDDEVPDYLLDNAILKIKRSSQLEGALEVHKSKVLSVPVIYANAILGHVVSPPDGDGKLRREHLYIKFKDEFFPSLSLVAAALARNMGTDDLVVQGHSGIDLGDTFIPTDIRGRMRVNYLGPEGTFHYVSAADVLDGTFDISLLREKIVFLGTSAISTYDFMVTPFSARIPAVEKNATVVENILNKHFILNTPVSVISCIILFSGVLLSFLLPKVRAFSALLASLLLISLYVALNQYLFTIHSYYLNFVYPFGNMVVITILFGAYKYFVEERKAKRLRSMFSSYVSPKVVNELINNPEMARLGGYRQEVTILFSDIAGFTSFSEKREPEEVVAMLNEYFGVMTDIIFHWDGTLDKFVGDEIMAFWGAPVAQADHAERAMRCAFHMSDQLDRLREKWQSEGKQAIDIGIGLNTGVVLIGNIGAAGKKMDFTAIGDHVNLGARVEALTRQYKTRILITEFTLAKLQPLVDNHRFGHIDLQEADTVKVKGKDLPVKVFSVRPIPHPDKEA